MATRPHSLLDLTPEHTHGHFETALMKSTTHVPLAYPEETMQEVHQTLIRHSKEYESIGYIYVVDDDHHLIGVLSVKELFRSPPETVIKSIMTTDVVAVHPQTDQEHVAIKSLHHKISAVPVIDKNQILLGVVPPDVILSILHSEHTEDFLRLAGVHAFRDPSVNIINASALVHITKRLPWLLLGLGGGLAAAVIVRSYENVLQQEIILAAFIPSIVYLADAVGTQTETLFIRSLAIDPHMNLGKYIRREAVVSVVIAAVMGSIIVTAAGLFWQDPIFMWILGISVIATILAAILLAIAIPFAFSRLKIDPAIAGGPFTTVVCDIVSLLIYFTISQSLLMILR